MRPIPQMYLKQPSINYHHTYIIYIVYIAQHLYFSLKKVFPVYEMRISLPCLIQHCLFFLMFYVYFQSCPHYDVLNLTIRNAISGKLSQLLTWQLMPIEYRIVAYLWKIIIYLYILYYIYFELLIFVFLPCVSWGICPFLFVFVLCSWCFLRVSSQ